VNTANHHHKLYGYATRQHDRARKLPYRRRDQRSGGFKLLNVELFRKKEIALGKVFKTAA